MSMLAINPTREELYKEYKKRGRPELAEKLLGFKHFQARVLTNLGSCALASAVFTPTLFLSIIAGLTGGIDPFVGLLAGSVSGTFTVLGFIMMAIGECKKRIILAKRLSDIDINKKIGKPLQDMANKS